MRPKRGPARGPGRDPGVRRRHTEVPSADPLRQSKSEVAHHDVKWWAEDRGAKVVLVTFAETKVTRRTGPAPR